MPTGIWGTAWPFVAGVGARAGSRRGRGGTARRVADGRRRAGRRHLWAACSSASRAARAPRSAFVIVAALTLALFLLGWRVVARLCCGSARGSTARSRRTRMNPIEWLFDAQLVIGDQVILWREIVGNVFGLASALGGLRRKVWAWPVGIVGNVLLFTVFLGAVFDTPNPVNLLGQAGRQLMFIAVSIYGWMQLVAQPRRRPHEAVDAALGGRKAACCSASRWSAARSLLTPIFRALGSFEPVWADAWIFIGSLLATWGMAKGWTEFWLIWVAVDIVGVPLLISAGYYASAFLYVFYGAFTIFGFITWVRVQRRRSRGTAPPDRREGGPGARCAQLTRWRAPVEHRPPPS